MSSKRSAASPRDRPSLLLTGCYGGLGSHIAYTLVEQGYRVYTDTTWAVGFAVRWLLTEIERRGVGADRVLFASDEPWSDFWGEYYKIVGQPASEELKNRILYQNFEELYDGKG